MAVNDYTLRRCVFYSVSWECLDTSAGCSQLQLLIWLLAIVPLSHVSSWLFHVTPPPSSLAVDTTWNSISTIRKSKNRKWNQYKQTYSKATAIKSFWFVVMRVCKASCTLRWCFHTESTHWKYYNYTVFMFSCCGKFALQEMIQMLHSQKSPVCYVLHKPAPCCVVSGTVRCRAERCVCQGEIEMNWL